MTSTDVWLLASLVGLALVAVAWRRDGSPTPPVLIGGLVSALVILAVYGFFWGGQRVAQVVAAVTWSVLIATLGHPAVIVDPDMLGLSADDENSAERRRRSARIRLYAMWGVGTVLALALVTWRG